MFQRFSLETKYSKTFIFVIYVFVFILGLCLGPCFVSRQDGLFHIYAVMLPEGEPVVAFRLVVLFLPMLLTVCFVKSGWPHLLLLLLLLKATLFSLIASGVCAAFSCSGWLLCCLLLFPDITGFAAYHWLWLRCLSNAGRARRDFLICTISLLSVFILDCNIICPFTALLFEEL